MTLRNPCGDLVAAPSPENPPRTPDNDPCGDLVSQIHVIEVLLMVEWCYANVGEDNWYYHPVELRWTGFLCRFTFHQHEHAMMFQLTWC